jgi:large subunit ribosomal protein L9
MEIILKEDIKGLGYKNDLVKVKPGYGRNYLIPQGLAILATPSARKVLAENQKQAAHKADKIKQDALNLAAQINAVTVEVAAKVSETGKIFGSVTSIQLAESLKAQHNIEVDRRKISFHHEDVKSLGEYTAQVDLHREVKASFKFTVVTA